MSRGIYIITGLCEVLFLKDILIVSYSFTAALIGAGFASGGEILSYFTVFGRNGIWGIFFFAAVCAAFLFAVFSLCRKYGAHSFDGLLEAAGGRRVMRAMRGFTAVFSFCVFSAMLSAIGEGLAYFGIPPRAGAFAAASLCAVLLATGTARALDLNGIIGLILTAAVITCCLYILRYREHHAYSSLTPAIGSAAAYSGYNLCASLPVLAVLSRRLRTRADAAAAAIISSGAVLIMMGLMFSILSMYHGRIPLGGLPMLTLAARQNAVFAGIYCAVIITASATTLIASGGSIIETAGKWRGFLYPALLSALGYFVSGFGFTGLVNTAYRVCGIAGIPVMLYIFYLYFASLKKHDFKSKQK